jgi:hypothetical protein
MRPSCDNGRSMFTSFIAICLFFGSTLIISYFQKQRTLLVYEWWIKWLKFVVSEGKSCQTFNGEHFLFVSFCLHTSNHKTIIGT